MLTEFRLRENRSIFDGRCEVEIDFAAVTWALWLWFV